MSFQCLLESPGLAGGEAESVRVHSLLSFQYGRKSFGEKCYTLQAVNSYSHLKQINVQVFLRGEEGEEESKGVLGTWGK